jgi:hypothetical protein
MYDDFYPHGWDEIATAIKEACRWHCQVCNRLCRRPGEFWLGWEYELHVAHITQDYEAEAVTVAALCGECHFLHDAPLVWVARHRAERYRRLQRGQLVFAFH